MNACCFRSRPVRKAAILLLCLAFLAVSTIRAQDAGNVGSEVGVQSQLERSDTEGIETGPYRVRHSIELGTRFVEITGNDSTYDTFVNFHTGPRILEQSLSVTSPTRTGIGFDDLYANSFGWGGEPSNAARVRVSKFKWYQASASFRRDQNFWDYNLLANPLNPGPAASNPSIQVQFSPHRFETRRRMTDVNLLVAPQSVVRGRFSYTRNTNEGPALSSFHEGTDVLVFQPWETHLDAYQFGVDVRALPRTSISYDQILQYYRSETSWRLAPFATFSLPNGAAVELGLPWQTSANSPCAPPVGQPLVLNGTLQNIRCNGYFEYERSAPLRTSYPTEQLSFQSRYFQRVELSGRVSYSASETNIADFREFFNGLVTRTNERQFLFSGPVKARRVAVNSDVGVTAHLSENLRLVDSFRFQNFRIPGTWDSTEQAFFAPPFTPAQRSGSLLDPVNIYNPATCPPPFTAAACPGHTASSPADLASLTFSRFLGQDAKWNTIEADYDFTRWIGARLGYRFGHRSVSIGSSERGTETFFPPLPGRGGCTPATGPCLEQIVPTGPFLSEQIEINEHSLLFGIWSNPKDSLRLSFDLEAMSADNTLTRISPRQRQQYKFRLGWEPVRWIDLNGSFNILESRNNVTDVRHRQHSRVYGFNLFVTPNDRFALQAGWDLTDIQSFTNICFVATPAPPGTIKCATAPTFLSAISQYDSNVHFVFGNVSYRPLQPLNLSLGYSFTNNDGNSLILNPNAPPGTLKFDYHRPNASVSYDFTKNWTGIVGWNYWQYSESVFAALTARRDFHANAATFSVRYFF